MTMYKIHCTCCSMSKGTSQAKVTLYSEEIIALAVVELCLFEGISQLFTYSVEIPLIFSEMFCSDWLKGILGQSESLLIHLRPS